VADGLAFDESFLREAVNARLAALLREALGNPFADPTPPDPVAH